ncbi:hypothetical protein HZB74_00700 [Candidatus Saccharibacteria bacterium]|nr:hypothetical protein [Candidatus Saccharibacteria bacterium]
MEFINPKKKKSPKFFEENSNQKVETIYDDPEWRELRDKVKKQSEKDIRHSSKGSLFGNINEPYDLASDEDKKRVEVNIKLSLPEAHWDFLKKLKNRLLNYKKNFSFNFLKNPKTYLIIGFIVFIVGAASFLLINRDNKDNAPSAEQTATTSQVKEEPVSHDPPFSPALPPSGINKEEVSYNPERNFAKFDDSIDGIAIAVSQQSLPEDFKSDPEAKLEELAKGFEATKIIQTGSGLAYIKETEEGPETIIFKKFDLLVFIRTQNKVSETSVISYINNLN